MTSQTTNSTAQSALHKVLQKPINMLLLHQKGSLKIGEVIRYTITYTPSQDPTRPSPPVLYLKIKNTCAIALRAAYLLGPYNLYAAAYPATYQPNGEFRDAQALGVPEFEPNLKPGGKWMIGLKVPDNIRLSGHKSRNNVAGDVSWIVEISSQVIFSESAAVNYELLLGREENILSPSFVNQPIGEGVSTSGHPDDCTRNTTLKDGKNLAQAKETFSRAIKVKVEDTARLWNKPSFPAHDDNDPGYSSEREVTESNKLMESVVDIKPGNLLRPKHPRTKKVHLVVLTHGLHSNLGADMLYLKESIDASAKQAKINSREREKRMRESDKDKVHKTEMSREEPQLEPKSNDKFEATQAREQQDNMDKNDDEEEVIVRGFPGNAARTERGIKYLGKRLARYILALTYPDQPFRPTMKKNVSQAQMHDMKADYNQLSDSEACLHQNYDARAYQITSISLIAHSLGGLVQMYAIGYVQKHSPEFFDRIRPINFIALASPFLGLSNENPLYVKFALDFGLVGRTGQDLGLTWRAPTIARGGWGAIVGSNSEDASTRDDDDGPPEAKPLLQILPTGPAHVALKKFKNRTVYSNVVNDGIVPLRTSCLLFLDWQGLGRVEKARREYGLVERVAEWGWAEITGANSTPARVNFSDPSIPTKVPQDEVPPLLRPIAEDNNSTSLEINSHTHLQPSDSDPSLVSQVLSGFTKLFSRVNPSVNINQGTKQKIYQRSQIVTSLYIRPPSRDSVGPVTTGDALYLSPPPKTSFFESAGDLLKPPLPSVDYLVSVSSRPQTIFHDRVYQSSDIPPPSLDTQPHMISRSGSVSPLLFPICADAAQSNGEPTPKYLSGKDPIQKTHSMSSDKPYNIHGGSEMKVEEKIARAYHRNLSWRKVLVRLEPDAHNNMIVRRMFANAYGWPVIKHLCDTHFSESTTASPRNVDSRSPE